MSLPVHGCKEVMCDYLVAATLADWGLMLVRGTGAGLRAVWLLVRLCGMC